jgi:hypothetical protein
MSQINFLQKLTVTQLLRKLSALYKTRMFNTVLSRTRHWLQSWAKHIQSTHSHLISLTSNFNIISCYWFQWTCYTQILYMPCFIHRVRFPLFRSAQTNRSSQMSPVTFFKLLLLMLESYQPHIQPLDVRSPITSGRRVFIQYIRSYPPYL